MVDVSIPELGSSGAPVAMAQDARSGLPWIALAVALGLHLALVVPAGLFGVQPDPRLSRIADKPEPIAIELVTDADLKARSAPPPAAKPPPPAADDMALPEALTLGTVPPATAAEKAAPALDLSLPLPAAQGDTPAGRLSQTLKSLQQSLNAPPKAGQAIAPKRGAVDTYTIAVKQALARRMPAAPGGSGSVEMTLALSETGTPTDVHLSRSSGIPAFDAAAMTAVWSCACPKAPAGSTQADRTIDVEFNF